MPELPEVETIRRALKKYLPGKRIERVLVRDPRLRWPVDEGRLQTAVAGARILDVKRRAKYLLIKLDVKLTLIIHLGMSGRILFLESALPFEKHDHVIFYFDDASELRFRDPRRFGMVDVVDNGDIKNYPRFVNLGIEPLSSKTAPEQLYEKAQHWKKPIKNLLMDANFIVGVGNIYANEALFYAGIHPATPSHRLSLGHWRQLLTQVQAVLKRAIKKGGTTLTDFVNSNGETGYFQLSLAVYGKEGEACSNCGTRIEKHVQVGRSTYFCPQCQPML